MQIEKYSLGIGDRFAREGEAQLRAFVKAREQGALVVPVWNKSHREHTLVHSTPDSVRSEAGRAVEALGWGDSFHVDADHIGLATVDAFLESSDFFTLDVAAHIGKPPEDDDRMEFLKQNSIYLGEIPIEGLDDPLLISESDLESVAGKFLAGMREAARIYQYIEYRKGSGSFITEVSIDETDLPQSPKELLLILSALAQFGVPVQTIAPKFTGRFNKGIDYRGDLDRFRLEFEADLAVLKFAVREFGLPEDLKLSVHSGSDKFSLYPIIRRAIREFDSGLHLKTAGTTWLEELIGLAEAGGEGLSIAQDVYTQAHRRFDELTKPYAEVIEIDPRLLPKPEETALWASEDFTSALRHDPTHPGFNPDLRQLLHVGFKVAAEMGDRYLKALEDHREIVSRNVTVNLYERHLKPLFLDD